MTLTIFRATMVLSVLAGTSGYADTITRIDHSSVNGVLAKLSEGAITLEARYTAGPKTLNILLSSVESIEFNSVAFNPGPPPTAPGLGPGTSPVPRPASTAQSTFSDAVELRGGNGAHQSCKVVSIDENMVHCEAVSGENPKGKLREYPRRIVLRILVGGGR